MRLSSGAGPRADLASHEALAAIEDALNLGDFDEIVFATSLQSPGAGVHLDLASKFKGWGFL